MVNLLRLGKKGRWQAFVWAAFGSALCSGASAEVAAWIRQWQDRAPDAAEIKIVSATSDVLAKNEVGRHLDIKAKAKVLTVERTEAGIKPGAVICIHYDLWNADDLLPGGTPIRIIATGDHLMAFIAKRDDDACFAPAAEGQSFVDAARR
ncbi:MAG: hypothetical protein QM780_10120 [Hyphomicrobium sp.]|uniref:hypothetical protein n=1 Tax=Hyphomicrobium sp. TaxID=82 RepID=UPI0039E640E4